MKKISLLLITILFLFVPFNYSFAETIQYKDWRTEDPNYYDINSYSELYSLFEDLNCDYNRLLEEYHSLENNIEEKNSEISRLEEEINYLEEQLKGEQIKLLNLTKSDDWKLIIIPIIIFGIPLFISYIYDKTKKEK